MVVIHYLQVWRIYLLGTDFMIKIDNAANTYFATEKKLSLREARWQEFLQEYQFEWQHKPARHNQVANTLNRKQVVEYVIALSQLIMYLTKEDGLLHAKGGRLFVPKGEKVRLGLLKEHHNTRWAGHLDRERMMALMARHFYWPDIKGDIEGYFKSYYVYQ